MHYYFFNVEYFLFLSQRCSIVVLSLSTNNKANKSAFLAKRAKVGSQCVTTGE